MSTGQLPLFEGFRPDGTRLTVTGSFDPDQAVPAFKLGDRVRCFVEGELTAVTHKRTKDNVLERQMVVVLDGITFDESPPRDGDERVSVDAHDLGPAG